jgi:hypothetical protein
MSSRLCSLLHITRSEVESNPDTSNRRPSIVFVAIAQILPQYDNTLNFVVHV